MVDQSLAIAWKRIIYVLHQTALLIVVENSVLDLDVDSAVVSDLHLLQHLCDGAVLDAIAVHDSLNGHLAALPGLGIVDTDQGPG